MEKLEIQIVFTDSCNTQWTVFPYDFEAYNCKNVVFVLCCLHMYGHLDVCMCVSVYNCKSQRFRFIGSNFIPGNFSNDNQLQTCLYLKYVYVEELILILFFCSQIMKSEMQKRDFFEFFK